MKYLIPLNILLIGIALTIASCTKNDLPVIDDPTATRDIQINSLSDVVILNDGFLVTGVRDSKIYFSKLDVNFNTIWEKNNFEWGTLLYSGGWGSGSSYLVDIKNIFVVRYGSLTCFCEKSEGGDVISISEFIVKLDKFGHQIFEKELANLWFIDIAKTSDNGYLMTGSNLIMLNTDYSKSWEVNNLNSDTYGLRIINTKDKGFAITGSWNNDQVLIQKLNSRGDKQWTKYNFNQGKFSDRGFNICQLPDNGFLIIGRTHEFKQQADMNCLAIRTTASGDTIWCRRFGEASNEWLEEILYISENDVVIQEAVGFPNDPVQKTILLKVSMDGQITNSIETTPFEKLVYSNSGYFVRAVKVDNNTIRFYKTQFDDLFTN
jgi:hypothetical protein